MGMYPVRDMPDPCLVQTTSLSLGGPGCAGELCDLVTLDLLPTNWRSTSHCSLLCMWCICRPKGCIEGQMTFEITHGPGRPEAAPSKHSLDHPFVLPRMAPTAVHTTEHGRLVPYDLNRQRQSASPSQPPFTDPLTGRCALGDAEL